MLSSKHFNPLLYAFCVLFSVSWLIYCMISNTVPVDTGDGLTHYFVSQATWSNPVKFIHHWGKPVFSLLASPFAQFGLNGIVTFNILVFLVSCWISKLLMNHLKVPSALQLIFPLVLLAADDYSSTILAGLTEPLFNLLVLFSALMFVRKKWIVFAIILSFLPFARSEGQLPLILGFLLILYSKQYKSIPFLVTGFVFYGMVGLFLIGNFWWYFTDSPYHMDNAIYGVGTWNHYLINYDLFIGQSGLILLLIGIPSMIYFLIKRRWEFVQFELSFFSFGIFIGIVGLHSYFWATGQNGSLGLTRIATQGMPLFLILNLSFIGRWNWSKHQLIYIPSVLICLILGTKLIRTKKFPQVPNAMEKQIIVAKKFIEPYLKKDRKVFYHFPYFSYLMNENPHSLLESSVTRPFASVNLTSDLKRLFKKGDFVIWDSHFGPKEMGMSLELIDKHKELVLVKEFISGLESVKIYQFVPVKDQMAKVQYEYIDLPNTQYDIGPQDEFTDVLPKLPLNKTNVILELCYFSSTRNIDLVFDNGNRDEYYSERVGPGDSLVLKFQLPASGKAKLYVWNQKTLKAQILLKHCRVQKVMYPEVLN